MIPIKDKYHIVLVKLKIHLIIYKGINLPEGTLSCFELKIFATPIKESRPEKIVRRNHN